MSDYELVSHFITFMLVPAYFVGVLLVVLGLGGGVALHVLVGVLIGLTKGGR